MRRRSSLCSWRSCHTCTSPATRRAACGSSNSSRWTGSTPWRPRPVGATANSAARLDRGWDGFCRKTQSLCLTLLSFASRAAGGGPEEARPARRHRAQRPRTQKTPGERFTSFYVQCDLSAQAHARTCNLCCCSVKMETLNLPERVEGAQPAAEVHPEPSEGAETAGGTR